MQEAATSSSEISNIGVQVSAKEDTGCATFVNKGTQTDIGNQEVLHDSKSVQTTPPMTSDVGVQTEDWNFFLMRSVF